MTAVQACVRTASRAQSSADRYCSQGSGNVHLRHMLPLALVWTKTRLARRRGLHINKYRQSQSGWSAPCFHGRSITQTVVGPVPFSHKYVEQQWSNEINICGQHCCTGTKLNVRDLAEQCKPRETARATSNRKTEKQTALTAAPMCAYYCHYRYL